MNTNQHKFTHQSVGAVKRAKARTPGRGVHAASSSEVNPFVFIGPALRDSWFPIFKHGIA
jgi:hypothetical protein